MIEVDKITAVAGDFVLRDFSLVVPEGEYGALMGRTGCGKTTLLEVIAGLKPVQAGRILLGGRDVTRLRPALRGIGYVPQDGALFTNLTVREHLAFALVIRRVSEAEIRERVAGLADMLGIEYLLERYPFGLSGGERQRVALGRALSFRPRVLLLDEPLSAVDEETREEMYGLLRTVHGETGVTVLHVTHNAEEARQLAQHVFRWREEGPGREVRGK